MQTQVTFRHFKSRPELQDAATDLTHRFEKYSELITSTNIEFIADAANVVELTVRVHGNTLVVKESSDDFLKSLHEGADKMVRQLNKWKTKVTKTKTNGVMV